MNRCNNYYWPIYKNLEKETLSLTQYIQFNDEQLGVYSMHICDLLIRCAVEIESISKELFWNNGGIKKCGEDGKERELYFDTDCISYLDDIWKICSKKIIISSPVFYFEQEENIVITPLEKSNIRGKGIWKKAYQAVKHDRRNNIKQGNIKNLIWALGSLYILNIYYSSLKIFLGKTNAEERDFDVRMGSEIFSVSFVNATQNVGIGGKGTDDNLTDNQKKELEESIYVIKYTDCSWKSMLEAVDKMNNDVFELLCNSSKFEKGFEKNMNLMAIADKVLGYDNPQIRDILMKTGQTIATGEKEAVIMKEQKVYG